MNWTVTAYWKYEYKDEVMEERKKVWKKNYMETAEEAISIVRYMANQHGEHWPPDTKWTAEKEK